MAWYWEFLLFILATGGVALVLGMAGHVLLELIRDWNDTGWN